ncbi:LysR family transcriptional regulator [Achromobacter anxifer]|uniref:HTH-type transcriptional regulator GltC n=1 Tax=Achromobacter anxifer TaxID=1287737 RepID=A0A6S7CX30_9BURK|nr:LysR family transcriptional regulator [Achromobacter anxifer]MDF8363166.1 LysR family transcriptional regulator [Achromobacter anxifer]CAB3869374.1 HTH-type transcriptional regulator GltC [Achromobacter anxifer]
MDEKLDARRTHYFMQVMSRGSVRGAAEVLDMDPSAVSRAIAALERDCGIALFERRGRGVVPTDAGHILARYIKRQQDIQESFFSEIDSLRKAERGHIDLVLGEGFVELMFERVLPGYWRSHPEVTLDIDVARTSEIVQRIVDDRAYIGLVFQPPNDARLRTHYSRPEPIRAIVREDHPLTLLRRPLLLTDLADYPGASMQEGFGVRQHIQAAEISEQVRLRNVLTTSSFKALWQFAAAGIGYALTPPIAVTADMRAQRLASLPLANPILNQGSLHVLSRAGRHVSPAARELLDHIVRGIGAPDGAQADTVE